MFKHGHESKKRNSCNREDAINLDETPVEVVGKPNFATERIGFYLGQWLKVHLFNLLFKIVSRPIQKRSKSRHKQ